jgi:putative redox protein
MALQEPRRGYSHVAMKKVSVRRREGYAHTATMRDHMLAVDEPREAGGTDSGPTPQELLAASLASCVAVTVEMYAERKGWEVGALEVEVGYEKDQKGRPTRFDVLVKLPTGLSAEQVERISQVAKKCPVHRALIGGHATIEDRFEQA